MHRLSLLALAGVLTLSACDSTEPDEVVDLEVQTAFDVEADLASGRDPETGQAISNNQFTLYDLDEGEIVLLSSETDDAIRQRDSASTAWDIGFRGTDVIFNGGDSGPGEGSAQIVTEAFADVTEAPASGYVVDGSNTCANGDTTVICGGSDAGWYNYANFTVTPIPGRTIVLTTGDGDYAKVRILSYYRGNPATPGGDSRYYTFEYVVQPDGSRDFDTTVAE